VGVDSVLDGQRMQTEGLGDLRQVLRAGLVQADPHEAILLGAGGFQRLAR
jgi:hypothetical protein